MAPWADGWWPTKGIMPRITAESYSMGFHGSHLGPIFLVDAFARRTVVLPRTLVAPLRGLSAVLWSWPGSKMVNFGVQNGRF